MSEDQFAGFAITPNAPASNQLNVTPSDIEELPNPTRAIFVGVAGTVFVKDMAGRTAYYTCYAGHILDIRCTKVLATGTTAGNIVAWW
jgi:hypothetical protein